MSSSSVKADFCLPADVNTVNAHFAGDPASVALRDSKPTARISPDNQFYFKHLHIFDCSLQSGVFPFLWKRAIVRPLPKQLPSLEVGHLRPISILCASSKIFGRLLLSKFRNTSKIIVSLTSDSEDLGKGIEHIQPLFRSSTTFARQ